MRIRSVLLLFVVLVSRNITSGVIHGSLRSLVRLYSRAGWASACVLLCSGVPHTHRHVCVCVCVCLHACVVCVCSVCVCGVRAWVYSVCAHARSSASCNLWKHLTAVIIPFLKIIINNYNSLLLIVQNSDL